MRLLITGGSGFIGKNLVNRLADHNVTTLADAGHANYKADITNPAIEEIFTKENPECVIHLAALINPRLSMKNPSSDILVNIMGTMNVLHACRKSNVEKVVFSSSCAVYGNPVYLPVNEKHATLPLSVYGASKLAAEKYIEMYCKAYGIKYTILRYANVYGPGSRSVVSTFITKVSSGERPVIFGNGSQGRDYVYVDDIAAATEKAISKGAGKILNIGTGKSTTVLEVLKTVCIATGKSAKPLRKTAASADIENMHLDSSLAKRELGWEPTVSFDEGVRRMIA